MLGKLPHYLRKCWQLGPTQSLRVIKNKLGSQIQERQLRIRAYTQTSYVYDACVKKTRPKALPFLATLAAGYTAEEIIHDAEAGVQKRFDLLGSGSISFDGILWHDDFRLRKQNQHADYQFACDVFYKDIVIEIGKDTDLAKDIKVPWELSRCRHFLILGLAYQRSRDERYAQAFFSQLTNWIEHNPYLLGPHWVCPMEVGIRALNWIVAAPYFYVLDDRSSLKADDLFWQQLSCSLYDHFTYLEQNWEIYDGRTSNHYLSDLVGYAYLCYYFSDLTGVSGKMDWVFAEIMRECDRQVFTEGSDYEGSTKYHALVMELFWLAQQLFKHMGYALPSSFENRLECMFKFNAWCQGVAVGDDDSGHVLAIQIPSDHHGLYKKVVEENALYGKKEYPQFGISFVRTNAWHISLRHHAYASIQPSGHFHNDVGSITVSVYSQTTGKYVPFILDPGSYVYTPSAVWRNYFRSIRVHNAFFLEGHEPVPLDDRLFALDIPECALDTTTANTAELLMPISLATQHTLYKRFGLRAHREVHLDDPQQRITITDWWELLTEAHTKSMYASSFPATVWNFTIAPGCTASIFDAGVYLEHEGMRLHIASPHLQFSIIDGWASLVYGRKERCKQVLATRNMKLQDPVKIMITRLA